MAEKPAKRRSVLFKVAVAAVGVFVGVAGFTFFYAGGHKYLGNDPATCKSCHVMNTEYNGWLAGSHANVATCNDCHLPHDSVISKYAVKAENGWSHGSKFTTGNYPQNIKIRDVSLAITNDACLHCHGNLTSDVVTSAHVNNDEQVSCVRCHSGVGHE